MIVEVFFNDAAGGSFAPGSPRYAASRERRDATDEKRAGGERAYLPMMDGYRADEAVLVESMLSPLILPDQKPLAALESAFRLMNGEFRSNGKVERSLSVGDVCVVNGVRYACQPVGWEEVE